MLFNGILLSVEIFHNVPPSIIEEACLSGADKYGIARHILLPIATRELINLYRVLWSVGWTAIIAAEMLGVNSGMGYRLLDFRYLLQYREMMIYIAIIGAIGIATDYGLLSLKKVCPNVSI
jgi:NitT/TauT family transport system permease protein